MDSRGDAGVLQLALLYWACRCAILVLMNCKTVPIFLYGTPDGKVRKESGRGFLKNWALDVWVNVAWLCMLAACVVVEVYLLIPTMKGLDWNSTCGLDLFG